MYLRTCARVTHDAGHKWLDAPKRVSQVFSEGGQVGGQHIAHLELPAAKAMGRPVGVATDARGGVLVADDVGNVVWRVSRAP